MGGLFAKHMLLCTHCIIMSICVDVPHGHGSRFPLRHIYPARMLGACFGLFNGKLDDTHLKACGQQCFCSRQETFALEKCGRGE